MLFQISRSLLNFNINWIIELISTYLNPLRDLISNLAPNFLHLVNHHWGSCLFTCTLVTFKVQAFHLLLNLVLGIATLFSPLTENAIISESFTISYNMLLQIIVLKTSYLVLLRSTFMLDFQTRKHSPHGFMANFSKLKFNIFTIRTYLMRIVFFYLNVNTLISFTWDVLVKIKMSNFALATITQDFITVLTLFKYHRYLLANNARNVIKKC